LQSPPPASVSQTQSQTSGATSSPLQQQPVVIPPAATVVYNEGEEYIFRGNPIGNGSVGGDMTFNTADLNRILDSLDGAPFADIDTYQGVHPLERRSTELPVYYPLATVHESNKVGNSKVVVIWKLSSVQILVEEINMNILNQLVDLDLLWL
jgi:hypothetical protein